MAEKTTVLIRTLPLALALIVLLPQAAAADTSTRIIVKRDTGLSAAERADIRADADVRFVESLPVPYTELVAAASGDMRDALSDLNADPDVRWAVAEPVFHASAPPPDEHMDLQWALSNTGQSGGTVDADLDGIEAWALSTGAGQTVAVVDTGADMDHPDLDANLRTDGVDYVDGSTPEDAEGHGTHVAGIIAAERGNVGGDPAVAIGVAGLANHAKVLPLRALDEDGNGSMADILDAFDDAGERGVRVVNASLGSDPYNLSDSTQASQASAVRSLFDSVIESHPNTLYVVAAGNETNNNDVRPVYPCNATAANLVCVGASTRVDTKPSYSNTGASSVDVLAPGHRIYSTINGHGYAWLDGTSMATPQVSAIAALVLAEAPTLPTSSLKEALIRTGPAIAAASATVTGRRVNALAALEWLGVDGDGDGSANGVDNCWHSLDTGDPDGDGIGGTCDLTPRGSDADGDGKPAVDDACPTTYGTLANGCPAPPNGDGDPFADAADACPAEGANTRNGCPLPALTGLSQKVVKRGARRSVTVRARTTRAAVVRILLQRKTGRGWVKVKKRTLATSANRVKLTVSRLRRGRHRIKVAVYSNAGSGTSATRYFRVR